MCDHRLILEEFSRCEGVYFVFAPSALESESPFRFLGSHFESICGLMSKELGLLRVNFEVKLCINGLFIG